MLSRQLIRQHIPGRVDNSVVREKNPSPGGGPPPPAPKPPPQFLSERVSALVCRHAAALSQRANIGWRRMNSRGETGFSDKVGLLHQDAWNIAVLLSLSCHPHWAIKNAPNQRLRSLLSPEAGTKGGKPHPAPTVPSRPSKPPRPSPAHRWPGPFLLSRHRSERRGQAVGSKHRGLLTVSRTAVIPLCLAISLPWFYAPTGAKTFTMSRPKGLGIQRAWFAQGFL